MPLLLRLKPEERVIIGGAVIKNGNHAAELFIENQVPILRRKDIMSEADATSPAKQIYFQIQLVYIDSECRSIHLNTLLSLIDHFNQQNIPASALLLEKIKTLITANDCYHALKIARELIILEETFL